MCALKSLMSQVLSNTSVKVFLAPKRGRALPPRSLSLALTNRWLLLNTSYYHVAVLTSECPIKSEKKFALGAAYPVDYLKPGKLFDRIVCDQLYNFLTNEDIINNYFNTSSCYPRRSLPGWEQLKELGPVYKERGLPYHPGQFYQLC